MQPIYIYKFDLERINKYVLLHTKNYSPYDELFCIVSSICLKSRIYINKSINNSYFTISEDWPTQWYRLNNVVSLNKKFGFHLMSFNSLIDLLEEYKYYEHITNILQLIVAKWDEWY